MRGRGDDLPEKDVVRGRAGEKTKILECPG